MDLPDGWVVEESSDEDSLQTERLIKHTASTLTVCVIPSTTDERFQLLLEMDSAGGNWLFEGGDTLDNAIEQALSFINIFQSYLDDEADTTSTEYLEALGEGLSKADLSLPSTLNMGKSPDNYIESFFNGYIPFHFTNPFTHDAELCCPPGASLESETHYRTSPPPEPPTSSYHVVWKESFGKGLGWYCPNCNPNSLADVNRLNIPCSTEWNKYMEKLEAGKTGEDGLPPIPESGHLSGGIVVRLFQSGVLKKYDSTETTSEEVSWYYDQDAHQQIIDHPEEWGQFVVGGDEDVLLSCDMLKADLDYNNGTETRFAVVCNPEIIDREVRTYPWDE